MKHNWNVRQTKKAIKAIASKLNDGDCASMAVGEFVRIIRHAPTDSVTITGTCAIVCTPKWTLLVGHDPKDGGASILRQGYLVHPERKAEYFGVDPYELSLIRAMQ